ncbi:sulfotransferase [Thermosulfurimonas sp. F29]|uniref:sulfotransferase family protein n=1 Tax=Thermosulfurimonas sp. F29 TaxID=2867247 RepID=UPI001C829BB1|nr:sulfotransferase [Thermosulfurimonas sp. F29]MBX6422897.1 sulfotransferase [Thermosulfurimonas sp. F29]
MIKLPNFLIVGAAKSGTTSLYYYLKEHPEIFLPDKKELRFFSQMRGDFRGPGDENLNRTIVKDINDYMKFFETVKMEKAVGDISPDYLYYFRNSIKNIKKFLGDPKIIIILRNPIERAYSHYLYFLRDGREYLSFEEALSQEERRNLLNWEWAWFYKDVGFYYNQVKAYLENFSEVKIYLYDDLKKDPLKLVQDIYKFLEVNDSFVPKSINEKFNISGVPKNKFLHKLLVQPNPIIFPIKFVLKSMLPRDTRQRLRNKFLQKILKKPQMKPETREYLKQLYKEDILKLQELIKRDLSHWLK